MLLLILPSNLFVNDIYTDHYLPSQIIIYYMTDDPWGWLGDSAYLPEDLMKDYPHCLMINAVADIKKLGFPKTDTMSLHEYYDYSPNHSYSTDARFVIQFIWSTHTSSIILGTSPLDINLFNNTPFVDEEYYNLVAKYVASKDRKFKKWYRRHYHKSEWHFFIGGKRQGLAGSIFKLRGWNALLDID